MTTTKRKASPKARRISYTIPQGIEAFLIQVARDMGTDDLKEALNFILWDIKRNNYQFKNGLRVVIPTAAASEPKPVIQPVTVQPLAEISPIQTQFKAQPPLIETAPEPERQPETDPVIQRLLDLGIEGF